METRKSFGAVFRCLIVCSIIPLLSGCFETFKTGIKTKSETEIAVALVKDEWLIACKGLAGPMPENEVGALLQDNTDLAAALADCIARQNSFVDYMKPIVKKERGNP